MPRTTTGTYAADDGALLHWTATRRDLTPAAVVAVLHGFGEHAALQPYLWFGSAMARRGLMTIGFDLRGHGRSPGTRGHVDSAEQCDADVAAFRRHISAHYPGRPLFLLGMSAGALPALGAAIEVPAGLNGLILVASALGEVGASAVLLRAAYMLGRLVPRLPFNPRLDLANLSRDPRTTAAIVADPLFHQHATAGSARYLLQTTAALRTSAVRLTLPLLMLHGTEDRIARPHDEIFEGAGCADKTLTRYPGARHNLLAETNRDEVYRDVAEWIEQRL